MTGYTDCGSRSRPVQHSGGSLELPFFFTSLPHCFPLPLLSTPESGARNACGAGVMVVVSPARDIQPAEIPPCPAVSWSARDSPRATARLRLRAAQRIGLAAIVE